jgi:hypothetical protein
MRIKAWFMLVNPRPSSKKSAGYFSCYDFLKKIEGQKFPEKIEKMGNFFILEFFSPRVFRFPGGLGESCERVTQTLRPLTLGLHLTAKLGQ